MKEIHILETNSEWENIKQEIPKCGLIIFKFSTACPISRGVERNFDTWYERAAGQTDLLCAKVDVRASRKLSQHIAQELRIRHESPQAIWMSTEQKVLWHASHYSITTEVLNTQLAKIQGQ